MTTNPDPPIDELEVKLLQAAANYQQNFYEITSDWNIYQTDERSYLKDFIGYGMYGPPRYDEAEPSRLANGDQGFRHFVYDVDKAKIIDSIYDKVIEYGTNEESNGVVLCGIIYNVIFNKIETEKTMRKKLDEEASKKKEEEESKRKEEEEASKKKEVEEALKKKEDEETSKKKEDEETSKKKEDDNKKGDETKTDDTMEFQVYPVPVFKVRTYVTSKKNKNNESNEKKTITEEIYYIDNIARVYKGFDDYSTNNTMPECTMVLPKDGRYQADPGVSCEPRTTNEEKKNLTTKVWLEIRPSPAAGIAAKVLTGVDMVTTAVTVATMGVGIAAMMTPIGAGVAMASLFGAGASGLWTAGRCAQNLTDRGKHGESINLTDKNALGSWIGIAGSTMGLASTGGTVLLTRAVGAGATVGRVAKIVYNAVQIGNLIVNGVGIGYKSYDIYANYKNGDDLNVQDLLFLTAHVFFFCNSAMNLRTATDLIETTQGKFLKDYENDLRSNRHRKEFQRIARNTRATGTNEVTSNEEIIRALNKIDNKDEFFQAMVRNRKAFSSSSARATFSSNGKVVVNGVMTIDPIEFASLPKDVRVDIVRGVTNAATTQNNSASSPVVASATKISPTPNDPTSRKKFTSRSNDVLKQFCNKHSFATLQNAPPMIKDFTSVLDDLGTMQNRADIFLKLLNMGYTILRALNGNEFRTVGDTLAHVVTFLWDYVKSTVRTARPGLMVIEDQWAREFLDELMRNLWVNIEKEIEVWVEAFKRWIKTRYLQPIDLRFIQ